MIGEEHPLVGPRNEVNGGSGAWLGATGSLPRAEGCIGPSGLTVLIPWSGFDEEMILAPNPPPISAILWLFDLGRNLKVDIDIEDEDGGLIFWEHVKWLAEDPSKELEVCIIMTVYDGQ